MDAHANFAYGTVLTAPSPATSGTTLVLNAGQGANFPTPPFNVVIWPANVIPTVANAEIGRCTGIATDTLTFTRATEGSSARTIVVGDQVAVAVTAKVLTDIETAAAAAQTTANGAAVKANNLSDLASASAARTSLGLGTAATQASSAFATAVHTHVEADVTGLSADLLLVFKRALVMGKAGAIGVTETDCADFMLVVPYDMTLQRIKVTLKSAATGSMVVQIRKATATITTPPTFADISGWTCTFSNGNVLATATPGASHNVSEGDALGFSVSVGSGVGMLVELAGIVR